VFNRTAHIKRGTMLYDIVKSDTIPINSFHHQAVKDVSNGVQISANSTDGMVEAIEQSTHKFLLAVQWHPELFYKNDVAAAKLFRAFVSATKE
jgi:putative glutamine amidotransferase